MNKKNKPMQEHEVQKNPDEHIDQDFPGFPHLPSDKKSITPNTETDKKITGVDKKKSKKVYGG